MVPFAGSSAPSGWLLCYGQAVSRTTYADLWAALDTTYGAGDGSTTFNLPDLRGRAAVGKDNMGGGAPAGRITFAGSGITGTTLGSAGGTETHTLSKAQLAVHNHTVNTGAYGAGGPYGDPNYYAAGTTGNEGSGDAHQNTQPSIILNYIIKT
jgi:microcystin-dependent protein